MRKIILIVFLLIACEPEPPQPKEVEKSIVAWKFPERKPSNWIIRGTIINPIPIDELNFIFIIDGDTVKREFDMEKYYEGSTFHFPVPNIHKSPTYYNFWMEYK